MATDATLTSVEVDIAEAAARYHHSIRAQAKGTTAFYQSDFSILFSNNFGGGTEPFLDPPAALMNRLSDLPDTVIPFSTRFADPVNPVLDVLGFGKIDISDDQTSAVVYASLGFGLESEAANFELSKQVDGSWSVDDAYVVDGTE